MKGHKNCLNRKFTHHHHRQIIIIIKENLLLLLFCEDNVAFFHWKKRFQKHHSFSDFVPKRKQNYSDIGLYSFTNNTETHIFLLFYEKKNSTINLKRIIIIIIIINYLILLFTNYQEFINCYYHFCIEKKFQHHETNTLKIFIIINN